jgi:Spy/CpxP family protein refolding chaperone
MFTRRFTMMILLLLAMTCPAIATPYRQQPDVAPDPAADRQYNRRHHLQHLSKELHLTPEQSRQIRTIISESRVQTAPLRERNRNDRAERHQAFRDRDADPAELRRMAYRQADHRIELRAMRQATRERIIALLTPEQRVRWEQRRECSPKQRERHRHGRDTF